MNPTVAEHKTGFGEALGGGNFGRNAQHQLGDQMVMVAIGVSALTAVVLGSQFVESGLAWGLSAALLLVAGFVYAACRGTLL